MNSLLRFLILTSFLLYLSCNKHKYINIKGFWTYKISKLVNSKGEDVLKYTIWGGCSYVYYFDSINENSYILKPAYCDINYTNWVPDNRYNISCNYDSDKRILSIANIECFSNYQPILLQLMKNSNNSNYSLNGTFSLFQGWGNPYTGQTYGPDSLKGNWTWQKGTP